MRSLGNIEWSGLTSAATAKLYRFLTISLPISRFGSVKVGFTDPNCERGGGGLGNERAALPGALLRPERFTDAPVRESELSKSG